MRVSPVKNTNNNISISPAFKSNKRQIGVVYNTTSFFRNDINWERFTDLIIDKYKSADKVNLYSIGCSDGSEAYTTALMLIKKLGKDGAKKFFPIKAMDKDTEILKNPMKGVIYASDSDFNVFNKYLRGVYHDYFEFERAFTYHKDFNMALCKGKVKPELQECVKFSKARLPFCLLDVEPENSVVMCRNVWPYLSHTSNKLMAEFLNMKLSKNSMCAIGDYDILRSDASSLLLENKFDFQNGNHKLYVKSEDYDKKDELKYKLLMKLNKLFK